MCCFLYCFFFFFKQKTAYEMRISDWSSDVCSSDLAGTNSGIHALKQWCLAPAFGCDARRALRRVVALGPRIHALLVGFSVPYHCIMALRHRVLDFLGVRLCALCVLCGPNAFRTTRRVHSLCAVPDTGTDGSHSLKTRLAPRFLKIGRASRRERLCQSA